MRVYLAGPLRSRPHVAACASALRTRGHTITSTWHDDSLGASSDPEDPRERWRIASTCLTELSQAQALVVLLSELWPARGTLWEAGAFVGQALGLDGEGKREPGGTPRVLWVRPSPEVPWPTLFDAFGECSTVLEPAEDVIADLLDARGWR
jgi:hypothetical protein